MENNLFRVFDREEYFESGFLYPSMLLTGYGMNQKLLTVMAKGYKDAAELIVTPQPGEMLLENDGLVYPFYACYRQAIECMLKAVLLNRHMPFNRGMTEVERRSLNRIISGHSIRILFIRARDSILEKGYSGYDLLFQDIGPYIVNYEKYDPSSAVLHFIPDSSIKGSRSRTPIYGFDVQYTQEKFSELWTLLNTLYQTSETDWCNYRFEF